MKAYNGGQYQRCGKETIEVKKVCAIVVVLLIAGLAIFAAGCGGVKISEILENPGDYATKEVSVSGTIVDRYWIDFLGVKAGAYQIDDGTGTIWVVTDVEPAEEGKKASAKGTVSTAGKVGDINLGTVIVDMEEE